MKHVHIVRIPARLSRLGTTEIYYEYVDDDWAERAERLQARRWRKLHAAAQPKEHARRLEEYL